MSQQLLMQLEKVTRKVNRMIDQIFSDDLRPERLYVASRYLLEAGGKRIRPFLVLKSCEIVGGEAETALPVAVAIEFIHNFTLIHDDIMDGDDTRRGVPTVHVSWGTPLAITAGDLLFATAYKSLLCHVDVRKVPPPRLLRVLETVTEATISICEGQALDMLFEGREDVTEEEYFEMIAKKTATLLRLSAISGAIVGGGTSSQVEQLGDFAYFIGLAFQVVDDILGLSADERVLGKPVGSDIREGKKTIVIIHALSHANKSQRQQILSILGNKTVPHERIQEATRILQSLGSIEYATNKADEFIKEAKLQLTTFPQTPTKTVLLNLCDYILSRKY